MIRDGISTKILRRWPDRIGEPINPEPIDWARWRATRERELGVAQDSTPLPKLTGNVTPLSRQQRRAMQRAAR